MKTILIPISKDVPKEKVRASIHLLANKSTYKLFFLHVDDMPISVEYLEDFVNWTEADIMELKEKEKNAFREFTELIKLDGYQVDISTSVGVFDEKFISLVNDINPVFIIMFTGGSKSMLGDIFGTNTSAVFEMVISPIFIISYEANFQQLSKAAVGLHLKNEDLGVLKNYLQFADEYHLKSSYIKIDNNFRMDSINDEKVLEGIQKLYPGKIEFIIHRESDEVAEGLEKYANESGADIIVLFTTKRNFIEKLFHKSITKDLILHSTKPLLIYHH